MAFRSVCDGGHGWLAVKRAVLRQMGILDKITRFSYEKGGTVYLEEDCDVTTFFKRYVEMHGVNPEIVQGKWYNGSAPCRYYASFALRPDDL